MKSTVESLKEIVASLPSPSEVTEILSDVRMLKEKAKGGESVKKILVDLDKLEKKVTDVTRNAALTAAKTTDSLDKVAGKVRKLEVGMGEGLEEVGLEVGVLKLKVGDVEGR